MVCFEYSMCTSHALANGFPPITVWYPWICAQVSGAATIREINDGRRSFQQVMAAIDFAALGCRSALGAESDRYASYMTSKFIWPACV